MTAMRKIPSWIPQALGYGVSAVCFIWLLHGYPIKQELLPALRELDWRWVSVAVLANLTVYIVQSWRWQILLGPVIRLRFWRTAQAIFIGLFANEVLPLRTGELIRCYLLAHWNDLRLSLSLASAAVERLIDGLFLVATFLLTVAFVRGVAPDLVVAVEVLTALLLISAAVLAWIVLRKHEAHAVLAESRWAATLRHVVEGLHLMGGPRTMGATTIVSVPYLFLQVVSVWALMKADEMDLSFWAAFGILAVIRLATVVPNAPGNLGLVNAACVTALRLFDVETNVAKTFSIMFYAGMTIPLLAAGALAVALTGLNIESTRRLQ